MEHQAALLTESRWYRAWHETWRFVERREVQVVTFLLALGALGISLYEKSGWLELKILAVVGVGGFIFIFLFNWIRAPRLQRNELRQYVKSLGDPPILEFEKHDIEFGPEAILGITNKGESGNVRAYCRLLKIVESANNPRRLVKYELPWLGNLSPAHFIWKNSCAYLILARSKTLQFEPGLPFNEVLLLRASQAGPEETDWFRHMWIKHATTRITIEVSVISDHPLFNRPLTGLFMILSGMHGGVKIRPCIQEEEEEVASILSN